MTTSAPGNTRSPKILLRRAAKSGSFTIASFILAGTNAAYDVPALFLKRPEHRLAHGLPLEAIHEFLAELASLIQPVEAIFSGGVKLQTRTTK